MERVMKLFLLVVVLFVLGCSKPSASCAHLRTTDDGIDIMSCRRTEDLCRSAASDLPGAGSCESVEEAFCFLAAGSDDVNTIFCARTRVDCVTLSTRSVRRGLYVSEGCRSTRTLGAAR